MAVTLTVADLIQPLGELDAAMLPGYDLTTVVTAWLAQAVALVETNVNVTAANQNAAAAAWVYYRAYNLVASTAMTGMTQIRVGPVSKTFSESDQRAWWRQLAASWLAKFNGYDSSLVFTQASGVTASLNNVAVW